MDNKPSGTFWINRGAKPHLWFVLFLGIAQLVSPKLSFAQNQMQGFDSLAAQAAAAREQNDIPRAIELYSQAVERKPDWSEGLWFLGSLQYGVGNYASARDALTRFL